MDLFTLEKAKNDKKLDAKTREADYYLELAKTFSEYENPLDELNKRDKRKKVVSEAKCREL